MRTTFSLQHGVVQKQNLDLGERRYTPALGTQRTLDAGTGADQADLVWGDRRSVTAGTPDDLELVGSLPDALGGDPITIARVVAVTIVNRSADHDLALGGGPAPFVGIPAGTLTVRRGGALHLLAPDAIGYLVTPTTSDVLRVAAVSGTIEYDILISGRSA